MSNLLGALQVTTGALRAYNRALSTSQQNLLNATTPGYARQRVRLEDLALRPEQGLPGGLVALSAPSARSAYAETAVNRAVSGEAVHTWYLNSLRPLEPLLDTDINSATLGGSLRRFFGALGNWAAAPQGEAQRDTVMLTATDLVNNFRNTADHLLWMRSQVQSGIAGTIDQLNHLAGTVQLYNLGLRGEGANAVSEATLYATLQELSRLAGVTSVIREDGAADLYLAGQTPLLLGKHLLPLRAASGSDPDRPLLYPGASEPVRIYSHDGEDVTAQAVRGQLAGMLQSQEVLASLVGDVHQQGSLNEMAQFVGERVNTLLTAGQISPGPPPVPGIPLFDWDLTSPASVMMTFSVGSTISADKLAAYDPGPPFSSNGTALKLATLLQSTAPADQIRGGTLQVFLETTLSGLASGLQQRQKLAEVTSGQVEQALAFRDSLSGVSLEEEAVSLITIQRSYEAASKVVRIIDEMLQTILELGR